MGDFTPPVLGPATIANFDTLALPGPGLLLALAASVVIGFGLWYHRKAYKPLVEASGGKDAAKPGEDVVDAVTDTVDGEPAASEAADTT